MFIYTYVREQRKCVSRRSMKITNDTLGVSKLSTLYIAGMLPNVFFIYMYTCTHKGEVERKTYNVWLNLTRARETDDRAFIRASALCTHALSHVVPYIIYICTLYCTELKTCTALLFSLYATNVHFYTQPDFPLYVLLHTYIFFFFTLTYALFRW